MDSRVLDSQVVDMDWVGDSQPTVVDREATNAERKTIVLAVIGVVSTLLELISTFSKRPTTFQPRDVRDGMYQEGLNQSQRLLVAWGHFLRNQLSVFRLMYLSFDTLPLRRISCPWYIKPRSIEWFYLFIDWSPQVDPERFRQFFRLSPDIFLHICNLVRDDMTSHAPAVFHCLPNRFLLVERQVAVALRRLATGDGLLGIGELFGLSKTTASRVTWKFCKSFNARARGYMKWPQGASMEEVKAGFRERWGFPNCCGAIDVTHFPIELPAGEASTQYYDWKHNLSFTMQAVVDVKCTFLDVLIGCPGSTQDSRLLRTSSLYHNVVYDETKLNGPPFVTPGGYRLREYLLGDSGYPLYNWLIVPYPRNQSESMDRFNHRHSSARMAVERAFGRLKGMWRLLSRTIVRPKRERLARTVLTCVLLHNMMLQRGEEVPAYLWNDVPPHPPGYGTRLRRNLEMFDGGRQAREALHEVVNRWATGQQRND